MKFKLEIDADNSAYEGESLRPEIARNLDAVRIQIERGYTQGIIKDTNSFLFIDLDTSVRLKIE